MFIKTSRGGYDRHGEQFASGLFLILVQPKEQTEKYPLLGCNYPIRALVRHTALRQLGHWMMGFVRVGKHRLTVSGSYGGDGLPMSVPEDVYERAIPIPAELYEAWKNGGGWNSAGSEAPAMRKWALENLSSLRGEKCKAQ